MPCYIRMKRSFLQGLLWLYLYGFGFMALSLEPGFLDFDNLPDTNFSCVGKVIGGYYADLETNCQMFHVCTIGQLDEPMDIRFLCLNGTVFDQETRVCERIDEVDCTKSEQFYSLNLELYGHSQSSNLEENSETEQPLIIKSTPTTTTTTTTPRPRKTTRTHYYTSSPTATTPRSNNHHISTHHFPILNPSSSDIRFNPEEINISLHPGAPPDIRTNKGPISYYSDKKVTNSNSDNNRLVVTTHRPLYGEHSGSSTQKSQVIQRYNSGTPSDVSGYGYTFRQEDSGEYTEPPESYRIRTEFRPSQEYAAALQNPHPNRFKSSTYRSASDYAPSTQKLNENNNFQQKSSTTTRNYYVHSLKPPAPNQPIHYGEVRTEKSPHRIQLSLPLLPTLSPLTFSSPAPFSLQQRIEQKRYTKDHFPPPRIVVSASASVSDASGRKLNYSLGTIGAAQLFKPPPHTYDEYKDEDVPLDPFYLDVPKVTDTRRKRSFNKENYTRRKITTNVDKTRKKRSISESRVKRQDRKFNYSEIIRNDEEALNVLKFLFDWYKSEKTNPARYTTPQATPLTSPLDNEGISSINYALAPETESSSVEDGEDNDFNFKFDTNDSYTKKINNTVTGQDGVLVRHEQESKINNVQENYTIQHEPDLEKENEDKEKEDEIFQREEDYINDNYEPLTYTAPLYEHKEEHNKENGNYYNNKNREFYKEENKNDSFKDDYVDDNIKPVYYKEREYIESDQKNDRNNIVPHHKYDNTYNYNIQDKEETKKEFNTSESNFNSIYNINEHIQNKKDTEENFEPTDKQSSHLENKEHSVFSEEQKPTISSDPQAFSTLPSFEVENTLTTERKLLPRKGSRRGNRKFTDIINNTNRENDFKPPVADKRIEKPYRAKDDYNFLRTIQNHNPTPKTQYQNTETEEITLNTQTEFIPTITESPTTSSLEPVTVRTSVEVITSITENDETLNTLTYTLTPAPITSTERTRNKPRRGKLRFTDYSNEEIAFRRRKLPTKSKQTSSRSRESNESKFLEYYDSLGSSQQSKEISTESDSQEPYSEILESTTNNLKRNDEVNKPSTVPKLLPTSTTSLSIDKEDKSPIQNSYLEVYATSFVPTTESVHITKKKQLKENLVEPKFETTTLIPTETTEAIPATTTWSPTELKKLIHDIESDTKSVAAPTLPKKVTTELFTEPDSTTESIIHTSTTPNLIQNMTSSFNMSGMNLVSVSIEEKPEEFESTTENVLVTTENTGFNENIEQSLDYKKEMNDFINKLDSKKFNFEFKEENLNSIEEYTTSGTTTLNLETTTDFNKYTQIPTTLVQTTMPPTTMEETSTETTQPVTTEAATTMKPRRKGGKPTRTRTKSRQNSSGSKHRFSRPDSRSSTESLRRGKELTTESFRASVGRKDYVLTDYPLRKSVNPTQAERTFLTTPSPHPSTTRRHFFFNCFGKEVDKFYPDLRDCRLFHYCTQGYTKNQLLDMKFVCDLNTFFDDEKLICTKLRPKRCL